MLINYQTIENIKTLQMRLKTILAALPGLSDVYNNSFILSEITYWTPLVYHKLGEQLRYGGTSLAP